MANYITYQYCGICRYKCTNASNNQVCTGAAYSIYQVGIIISVCFSNFKENNASDNCLDNWLSGSENAYLIHSNILDNQADGPLILSYSSIHIENCNIINNKCEKVFDLFYDINVTIVNCYTDILPISDSHFVDIQTTNQEIPFTRCPKYLSNSSIDENAETIVEKSNFFTESIISFYAMFTLS